MTKYALVGDVGGTNARLALCDIASGRCELFFECRLSPWDYAAGSLIVQEAGGRSGHSRLS